MKTGPIIALTAGGALGALLLGGGAFAAGVAISDEVRSDRAASMVAEGSRDQQMRGEGPRDGFDRPHDEERGKGIGRGVRGHSGDVERQRGEGHQRLGNHDGDQLREGPGHVDMDEGALQQEFSMAP